MAIVMEVQSTLVLEPTPELNVSLREQQVHQMDVARRATFMVQLSAHAPGGGVSMGFDPIAVGFISS